MGEGARRTCGSVCINVAGTRSKVRRYGPVEMRSSGPGISCGSHLWGGCPMKRQSAIGLALLALGLGGPCLGAEGQKAVAIHAGQLFDGKSDRLVSNQVIVIQGDRIAEMGPAASVKIPAGAEEIDLAASTVLPGLIESHNHMFKIGDYPGTGADAAVPRVIQPGTPFSTPY